MRLRLLVAAVIVLAVLATLNYFRPIPAATIQTSLPSSLVVPGSLPSLPWPAGGSGALAVSGLGFLASSGNEQPLPAASVTKVMTALLILEDKPLDPSSAGPTLTLTDVDVASYVSDVADKESVAYVAAGEQLTELQLLEGMLIPSANNYAQTLARWDAGSEATFVTKMNARAASLGMKHTSFADPSGALAQTVSTPSDLLVLGEAAMKQAVFRQIVAMGEVVLPLAGRVFNVDRALGQSGIVGIKTGSGFTTGANFLFASSLTVDGHTITLYGCVMGLTTLDAAFAAAKDLVAIAQPVLHVRRVLNRAQIVATVSSAWGAQTYLVSTYDVDLVEWPGMVLREHLQASPIEIDSPIAPGTKEGIEHMVLGEYVLDIPVVTSDPIYPPGRFWRLTRFSG